MRLRGMLGRRTTRLALLRAFAASCLLLAVSVKTQDDFVSVVKVATAAALKEAFASNAAHIHIAAHLNLSSLPMLDQNVFSYKAYFALYSELKSLTVRRCQLVVYCAS